MKRLLTTLWMLIPLMALSATWPNYYVTNPAPVLSPSASNAVTAIISTNSAMTNLISVIAITNRNQFTTNTAGTAILGSFAVNGGVTSTNFVGYGRNVTNVYGTLNLEDGVARYWTNATDAILAARSDSGIATFLSMAGNYSKIGAQDLPATMGTYILSSHSGAVHPRGGYINVIGTSAYRTLSIITNDQSSYPVAVFDFPAKRFYLTNGFVFAGDGSGITNMNPTNVFISGSTIQSNMIVKGVVDEASGLRDYAGNLVTTWGWYFTNDPPGEMFTNRDTLVFYKTNNLNPYTSDVTAHLAFLSMNRTNGYVGIGTNDPVFPFIAVAPNGGKVYLESGASPAFVFSTTNGAVTFYDDGAVVYIGASVGQFDTIRDDDAGDPAIDVLNRILVNDAGDWSVNGTFTVDGSVIVTNSIIATNAYGTNDISLPYAQYSSSTDQTVTNVATTNIVIFTDVDAANRITPLTDPGTWSKTYIQEAGAYLITVSAIADASGATTPNIHLTLWLAVNGVIGGGGSVPRSATTVAVPDANLEHTLMVAFNYVFAQGDYFELWYSGEDTDLLFNATAAGGTPVKPASPSVIMSVNKISSVP